MFRKFCGNIHRTVVLNGGIPKIIMKKAIKLVEGNLWKWKSHSYFYLKLMEILNITELLMMNDFDIYFGLFIENG